MMGLKLSGYYNATTGAFYATKSARDAAGDSAAVYGRFYSVLSFVMPTGVKQALHERGCSAGLNPPASSSDRAM